MNMMKTSPFDTSSRCSTPLVNIEMPGGDSWVPSRFNSRTVDADGNTILWNSKAGSISVFPAAQKQALENYLSQGGVTGGLDALGTYLKDRGYIVSTTIHELRQFRVMFGEQHFRSDALELILLASEDCNLRCRYCYEDFPRGMMEERVRAGIKRLVETRVGGLKRLNISWFGGEPLYGLPAIDDLAGFFDEISQRHDLQYSASMTTNGYLLTPDVAERLISWRLKNFQITVDGLAEQHDHNRPGRDGSGTFDTIFGNLKALKASTLQFFVRLRVNFDRDTHPHLEKFMCFLQEEIGSDPRFGLAFYGVGKWGGSNDANLNVCGVFEANDVRAELQQSAYQKGLKFNTLADRNLPGQGVCYAARPFNFVIGADGKVMKCTVALDKDPSNIVGFLSEDGTIEMNHDRFSKWVEPAFESDPNCQKCHILPACQGMSCPLLRFEHNTSPCAATVKHSIHHELVGALNAKKASARQVAVGGAR
jgi:uncharacterized protein